jgi:flagellar hook-associated protein 1
MSGGTFFGIGVAQSGLNAQRRAMDILGYNIAHANDPTYKRQRLVMADSAILASSQEANPLGSTPFGTGVGAGDVERVYDTLIENRLRFSNQAAAQWDFKSTSMQQIESIYGEPGDSTLQSDLDAFWNSWQKVATNPESLPIKSSLLEDTEALCNHIRNIDSQMSQTVEDLNLSIKDKTDRINSIGEEIAKLNNEIGALESGAVPINDLQNRRDALVLELSKLTNITQHGDGKENYIISISGRVFVQGSHYNKLETVIDANNNRQIQWENDHEKVDIKDGEVKGILDMRDVNIPSYISQLNDIAKQIVTNVNALHSTGMTSTKDALGNPVQAGNFFDPAKLDASSISLDPSIINHPELVGSSQSGAVGDGEIANQIALLKEKQVTGNGLTINQLYSSLVQDIGSMSSISQRQAAAHKLSMDQFTTQQQSISGVSLDEEMTNMIKFQQAYSASARVISAMNDMLGILMSAGAN